MSKTIEFSTHMENYFDRLSSCLKKISNSDLEQLVTALEKARNEKQQIFLIGNGGSAANAMHIANDFIYGASNPKNGGFRVNALTSNTSVITCLANDEGYEKIFEKQLVVLASKGDILVALSGSGNSKNIICALQWGKLNGIKTIAIVGFSGGKAKTIADHVIHIPEDDMQISEDIQLVTFHCLMQWLCKSRNIS